MKNNQGFTLIECLIALLVLISLLLFISPLIKQLPKLNNRVNAQANIDYRLGKVQLQRLIQSMPLIDVDQKYLKFRKAKQGADFYEEVTISLYPKSHSLRRTPGHHVIMTNVKTITFSEEDQIVRVELETCENQKEVFFLYCEK
ncbi:hypothetical protein CBF34_10805 [Vagococcus penaei]|uniref:Uncharacterized protein n=1 Tax=Vagococcus penaei TaxID=633807 RepID=A0A1Q2D5Z4_9ENTE|nr:competence type IV pilus minor pilin ComGF [Vagococcus penaei]AQP53685.1 hypothetical protein BW732_05160 [Vagococcus penaei]RST97699.1 hypothetical protein CBF34_10805 [Vagococcus penaei]